MHHELGDRVKFKLYQLYAFSTNSQLDEGGGAGPSKKEENSQFAIISQPRGGGGSGEVGMVSQV